MAVASPPNELMHSAWGTTCGHGYSSNWSLKGNMSKIPKIALNPVTSAMNSYVINNEGSIGGVTVGPKIAIAGKMIRTPTDMIDELLEIATTTVFSSGVYLPNALRIRKPRSSAPTK
ncbi:MAG: hypothetical protein ACTSPC_12580 [Candidatus Heimdallarchaeota archaeon]